MIRKIVQVSLLRSSFTVLRAIGASSGRIDGARIGRRRKATRARAGHSPAWGAGRSCRPRGCVIFPPMAERPENGAAPDYGETEVIARLQAGDAAAYADLVRTQGPRML